MKCPKCGEMMNLVSTDQSFNFDTTPKTEYKRERYKCKADDIWITVEIPTS